MAQNVIAHAFEPRCHNFPDFHLCYFLAMFETALLLAVFGDSSPVSSPLLGIMIRRLLNVP